MSLNTYFAGSPIKCVQEELLETLACLNVPSSTDYGISKFGRKTRIVNTDKIVMEVLDYNKVQVNHKKIMSVLDVKRLLLKTYLEI